VLNRGTLIGSIIVIDCENTRTLTGKFHCYFVNCLHRFYARTSRHYVELDQNGTAKGTANFLDGQRKRATRSSGPPNYLGSGDVTVGHMTTGNGQYFVLDAEAVNREAILSSQQRSVFQ